MTPDNHTLAIDTPRYVCAGAITLPICVQVPSPLTVPTQRQGKRKTRCDDTLVCLHVRGVTYGVLHQVGRPRAEGGACREVSRTRGNNVVRTHEAMS